MKFDIINDNTQSQYITFCDSVYHSGIWHYPDWVKFQLASGRGKAAHNFAIMDDNNQIDTLLSKYLTDNLPLNIYDNCIFRLRVKLFINKRGQAKIIKTFSDTPKILVRQINSLLEDVKFQPAENNKKSCSFTANVMLLIDFTKPWDLE